VLFRICSNAHALSNDDDITRIINNSKSRAMNSPCQCNPFKTNAIVLSSRKEDNVYEIKNDEAQYNDPCTLFKVKVKTISSTDVIGIEDALEMKKRFCFVKCVSTHAKVKRVSVVDFVKTFCTPKDELNLKMLMKIIAEKKAWLTALIKNAVRNYAKVIKRNIDDRYNNLAQKEENENDNVKHMNLAHKLKQWGSDIDEVAHIQNNIHYNKQQQAQ
jgi:hypothetical protein